MKRIIPVYYSKDTYGLFCFSVGVASSLGASDTRCWHWHWMLLSDTLRTSCTMQFGAKSARQLWYVCYTVCHRLEFSVVDERDDHSTGVDYQQPQSNWTGVHQGAPTCSRDLFTCRVDENKTS